MSRSARFTRLGTTTRVRAVAAGGKGLVLSRGSAMEAVGGSSRPRQEAPRSRPPHNPAPPPLLRGKPHRRRNLERTYPIATAPRRPPDPQYVYTPPAPPT